MQALLIREAKWDDCGALALLRHCLWPDSSGEEHARELTRLLAGESRSTLPSVILVAQNAQGEIVGFVEAGLRSHADGCDDAEGDAIGYEGAEPVFQFLGAPQNLALDLYMGGGGHSLKPAQAANIVNFANTVLFGKPLADDVKKQLTTDPYLNAGTYERYYGGLQTMMPWAGAVH